MDTLADHSKKQLVRNINVLSEERDRALLEDLSYCGSRREIEATLNYSRRWMSEELEALIAESECDLYNEVIDYLP